MGNINKSELKNILSPLKRKIDNCIDKETLNKKLEKKLSLTGGSLVGPLTIINGASNIILSAQQDSARLSIGTNHLDLTNDGKLKVNDKEVGSSNKALEADLSSKLSLTGGTLTGSLSIKNGDTTSTLSTESDSARLSIGNNHLDLTSDGKLKVNDKEVGTGNGQGNPEVQLNNNLINVTETVTIPGKTTTVTKNEYSTLTSIPYGYNGSRTISLINDDVYLFGGEGTSKAYKYNITNDNYTQLTNTPESVGSSAAVTACAGYSYIFGAGSSNKSAYKYDQTTDTYTKLTDLPTTMSGGIAINDGTSSICLFGLGTGNSNEFYYIYTFDSATSTYTKRKNIPNSENFEGGCGTIKGKYIYLFGGSSNHDRFYVYDRYLRLCYDTPTTVTGPVPVTFGNAAIVGDDIYVFGGFLQTQSIYKFDDKSHTFTKMTDLPYSVVKSGCTVYNDLIYVFGGNSNSTRVFKYNPVPTTTTVTSPSSTTTKTYTAVVKPTGHSIYTANNSYTSTKAALIKIASSDYYTEYDENNNVIKNTATISGTGSTKIYVKSGGKFHGKALSGSGWTTINILDYI